MPTYTVFDEGQTRTGEAKAILETIRAESAGHNPEIAVMDVDQYADALIEDAPYFLPDDLLSALEQQQFATKHDRALAYLSVMPNSHVRILSTR